MKDFIEQVERGWAGQACIGGVLFTSRAALANDRPIVDTKGHSVGVYDPKDKVWITIVDALPSKIERYETAYGRTDMFEQILREAGRTPIRVAKDMFTPFVVGGIAALAADKLLGEQS